MTRIARLAPLAAVLLRLAAPVPDAGALALPDPAGASPPSPAPVTQALLMAGNPFPPRRPFATRLPPPKRTFFAAPGPAAGDGSETRPWNDLQSALRALDSGDRLRVRAGKYTGPFRIDDSCREGKTNAPIQVVFDGKATIFPARDGDDVPALTIRRSHWYLLGTYLDLGNSPAPGIALGTGAFHVTLDGARLAGGRGPGVRVEGGAAQITIANSRIAKSRVEGTDLSSVGIQILAGARHVLLSGNQLHENPAGSIRVEKPSAEELPASDVRLLGNTIHEDDATAVMVRAASGVRITGNTIFDVPGRTGTRGIALENVRDAIVRSNHVVRCETAIQIGRADPVGRVLHRAVDVTIDHNVLEGAGPGGTALAIEAGERIRFANNVVEGYSNGLLLFGKAPQTTVISVANNLVIDVPDVAFRLDDPSAAVLFDYNVFSAPASATVEVAGKTRALTRFLEGGSMPHTRAVRGVRLVQNDLARIEGVETVDRGTPVDGIPFHGAAPDIGVFEK